MHNVIKLHNIKFKKKPILLYNYYNTTYVLHAYLHLQNCPKK